MTFTTAAGAYDQGKADIQSLSVDDQLGLLWFVYKDLSIPAVETAATQTKPADAG